MDRIEKLIEFLKESPDDSFLQHALALEYIKLGKEEDARKLFTNILDREPDYIGSYYHLAKLLERLNENGEAMKVYKKGIDVAKAKNDRHAYSELLAAYNTLKEETE